MLAIDEGGQVSQNDSLDFEEVIGMNPDCRSVLVDWTPLIVRSRMTRDVHLWEV